jgi:hypothetical protein
MQRIPCTREKIKFGYTEELVVSEASGKVSSVLAAASALTSIYTHSLTAATSTHMITEENDSYCR